MKYMKIFTIVLVVLFILWILSGWLSTRNIEEPKYDVVSTHDQYEVREYQSMIIAKTVVTGTREEAANEGFRRIADYIFGNNIVNESIAMTAPVTAQESETISMTAPVTIQNSESIAMTAPVTSEESSNGQYTIAFVMPSKYTMETLPQPVKEYVKIEEIPTKKYAVIEFSGYMSDKKEQSKKQKLVDALETDGVIFNSQHILSQYDPPWTPWFMRRNEIWVEVE